MQYFLIVHKSFDWVLIDFNTLELKTLASDISEDRIQFSFSFMEKMNIIKFRRLVLEYVVMNIIDAIQLLIKAGTYNF